MQQPSRRNVLSGLSLAAATAGAATLAGGAAEASSHHHHAKSNKKPNIVFFLGEGLRWDEFSFMGHPLIRTPNIDRLAKEGVVFNNAFCTNALCGPSRCTVMTGAYSHSTGAVSNIDNKVPENFPMIGDVLHKAGYDVAFVGKNHVKGELQDHYWDYYLSFPKQGKYINPTLTEGKKGKFEKPRQFDGYLDDIVTDKAVEWLENREDKSKPYCLFVWFYAPHAPFYRPRKAADRFNGERIAKPANYDEDLGGYKGKPYGVKIAFNKVGTTLLDNVRNLESLSKDHYVGVENNDDNVGKVMKKVAEQNALEETAFVLSSDHGFFLGEHNFYDKRLMYEESIRIPMVIRYPSRIAAGTKRDEAVLTNDLAPTIYDLCGVATPKTVDGRSVMPLAEGKKVGNWRTDWLYEYYEYPGFENVPPHRGVRNERFKYIHYFTKPFVFHELYDIKNDPTEMNNLYGKPGYEKITRQLQKRLAELRKEYNDQYSWKPSPWPKRIFTKVMKDRIAVADQRPDVMAEISKVEGIQ